MKANTPHISVEAFWMLLDVQGAQKARDAEGRGAPRSAAECHQPFWAQI